VRLAIEPHGAGEHPGIASVWARKQIEELEDHASWIPGDELPDEVERIALEYRLVSSQTAFVAVDSSRRTEGEFGVSVPVPVPVPDGVRYDTTVGK